MNSPLCHLRVVNVELRVQPMKTRMPFRYGIATLNSLPHLYLVADVDVDGRVYRGISSEGLAPKWFTKNPRTSTKQDLADMIAVIQSAARLATVFTRVASLTFFGLWQMLQKEQSQWAFKQGHPPLLWQLGISLLERAVLDALCKRLETPLHKTLRSSVLGLHWGQVHPALTDFETDEFLPEKPIEETFARHTIGLGDPLTAAEIPEEERLSDGLPQALEDCIGAYGLRYFKVKLNGSAQDDHSRLQAVQKVLETRCGGDYHVTLDGNEHFQELAAFRTYYDRLRSDPSLEAIFSHLLWVEQPLQRDKALADGVGPALQAWKEAPTLVIDESDGNVGDAHKAMRLGYSGVSHKNCKGIVKGLANAAFVHHHRRLQPKKTFVLSGEDLATVGPIALTQDLAMVALLGIPHVERNGHHYFNGLSMHGDDLTNLILQAHPDLYGRNSHGTACLRISNGKLSLNSVNTAPFGCDVEPDLSIHPTVKDWLEGAGLDQY
jgi:L-alanine-DL-glutamate epimerase-like enolase superfamily enzyme